MPPTMGKCETCGEDAMFLVFDFVEQVPDITPKGEMFAKWAAGTRHRFCATHTRPPSHVLRKEPPGLNFTVEQCVEAFKAMGVDVSGPKPVEAAAQ